MKPIDRRTLLRGVGTSIALPWLDAMSPISRAAKAAENKPIRMLFLMVPNGIHMADWTPTAEGANISLPRTLEPLAKHQKSLNIFTGLTLDGARDHGDGAGDHPFADAGCGPARHGRTAGHARDRGG